MARTGEADKQMGQVAIAYRYLVDEENRILDVDDAWLRFAVENDAPELDREAVLGEPLWQFIGDAETRLIYEALLARVREGQRRVSVPFRCDSPAVRRFMEMEIVPAGERQIALTGHLLRREERAPVPLLDPTVARSDELISVCSWCKKVELSPVEWVEVEEAVTRLDLFARVPLPGISHGICPSCSERFHSGLNLL